MGLRINTNVPALSALRNLQKSSDQIEQSTNRLSSGEKINKAADDAAGLAISENLRAEIRGLDKAKLNAEGAVSMVQVAEGGLNEISNILIRLRELSIQGASGVMSDNDRGLLDLEFKSLSSEVDRIAKTSEFQGRKLLTGDNRKMEFQVGTRSVGGGETDPNVIVFDSQKSADAESLGLSGLDVSNIDTARSSIDSIDKAISNVNEQRAGLGAVQNRLQSSISNLSNTSQNMSAAKSVIRDADIAEESSKLVKAQVLQSAGLAILAQANANTGKSLMLLS